MSTDPDRLLLKSSSAEIGFCVCAWPVFVSRVWLNTSSKFNFELSNVFLLFVIVYVLPILSMYWLKSTFVFLHMCPKWRWIRPPTFTWLQTNFWADKNVHGTVFRLHGTRGTLPVFERQNVPVFQPRSPSSSVISDVTSPVKFVGKIRRAIALGSKPLQVTRIARTALSTRLPVFHLIRGRSRVSALHR